MNIFDWLNEISYKKSPWSSFSEDDKDNFNSYMINRFVSMKSNYIDLVNLIQKYTIPKSVLYNYYCKTIPKSRTFFRYIKPKKSNINKDLLNILSKHLQLSKREIKDNYNLIGKDFKIELLTNLNIDNKQIKKLLK
mgnify:FL=1|jgi:hypothetical protein|tara:strand:- start:2662 stop:3069 length:408 start_codon:yes stop_codon:yes gene_type:complete